MLKIEFGKPLDKLTTFGLRAEAEAWGEAASIDDIKEGLALAKEKGWPVSLLGGGSNVVAMSKVPGLVLHPNFPGLAAHQNAQGRTFITAGASEKLDDVVRFAVAKGLGGLENLAGIPGSVGGAIVQNAGAYGVEIAERLAWVRVWDPESGEVRLLDASQCDFGYRSSVFKAKGSKFVLLEAAFALPIAWTPNVAYRDLAAVFAHTDPAEITPKAVDAAVRSLRAKKLPDPTKVGSAGSFFKNPVVTKLKARELITLHPNLVSYPLAGGRAKLAAGWLIEAAGLKDLTCGDAAVWPKHALILVNRGAATGEEVLSLAREIVLRVDRRFGVRLEPEPVFLGAAF